MLFERIKNKQLRLKENYIFVLFLFIFVMSSFIVVSFFFLFYEKWFTILVTLNKFTK